jgi:5'-nucleotidase
VTRSLILVTNDDGIDSPGLAAAAAALDPLGDLLIVAPAVQQTSMSRSRSQQHGADGRLFRREVRYGDQVWPGVAANATPALAVEHALLELADRPVSLAVSGINYGENVGTSVTVSGTIAAAIEAAERGVPALAVSLEVDQTMHFAHDQTPVDFDSAIHFVRRIAAGLLAHPLPADVDLLKLEIPASATPESPLMFTRQDRLVYYELSSPRTGDPFDGPVSFNHRMRKGEYTATDTDAYALARGAVSVTPLSLDLTSRVDRAELLVLLDQDG